MSPQGKAEMVVALNEYGRDYHNTEAADLSRELLQRIMDEDNKFVYTQFRDRTEMEYLSLAAIDRAKIYTKLRLVIEDQDITMSRTDSGKSCTYRYGNGKVRMEGGVEEALTAGLMSQRDSYQKRDPDETFPYLDEEDAKNKLKCRAEYIEEVNYAIVVTTAMEVRIQDIYDTLVRLYTPT
jgi:hypothetical protein